MVLVELKKQYGVNVKEVLTEEDFEYIFSSIEDEMLKEFINQLIMARLLKSNR